MNYRLQIQIHEISSSDTATIFHAGILWDKATHPWFDLADVIITTPLAPDVLEKTRYDVGNHPASLGFVEATCPEDYNSIAYFRMKVYPFVQTFRHLKLGSVQEDDQTTLYNIEVETGSRHNASTNASITIRITGTCKIICTF